MLPLEKGDHRLTIEYLDDADPAQRTENNRRLIIDSVRWSGPEEGLPAFSKQHTKPS